MDGLRCDERRGKQRELNQNERTKNNTNTNTDTSTGTDTQQPLKDSDPSQDRDSFLVVSFVSCCLLEKELPSQRNRFSSPELFANTGALVFSLLPTPGAQAAHVQTRRSSMWCCIEGFFLLQKVD